MLPTARVLHPNAMDLGASRLVYVDSSLQNE